MTRNNQYAIYCEPFRCDIHMNNDDKASLALWLDENRARLRRNQKRREAYRAKRDSESKSFDTNVRSIAPIIV